MKYKEFELDQFQIDAIKYIDDNKSVVVSAGTGTGKTLVADYLIDKCIQENKRVVYTSPIKALSNQKFKDFKKEHGADKIGLLTGDVSINPNAQVLIMTTEIYRNMLLSKDEVCEQIAYVIFDEVHYINDIERGTIWEESIIFSLPTTQILALSATIPNAQELCDWISSLRKNYEIGLVYYDHRAVPLNHYFYEHFSGLVEREKLEKKMRDLKDISRISATPARHSKHGKKKRRSVKIQSPEITKNQFIDLCKILHQKEWTPAIFFSFSRKSCEEKAKIMSRKMDMVSESERNEISKTFRVHLTEEVNKLRSVSVLKSALLKGYGIHHAGMLPAAKDLVEDLFSRGLVKVLFATETFAVGINMPAKAVCFATLEKYDGVNFRYLNTKEYFQMAGRAGRRGIDEVGYAITLIEPDYSDIKKVMRITEKDIDPIKSQYSLSFNTSINLLKYHDQKNIERILKSNLDYFMRKKKDSNLRIMATFNNQVKRLKKLECVDKDNNVLPKGNFMSYIYANEIVTTEMVYSKMFDDLNDVETLIMVAALAYEERRNDHFRFVNVDKIYNKLTKVISTNPIVEKQINKISVKRMISVVRAWSTGCEFTELMELSNLLEGDYIRMFRQIMDRMTQMIKAGVDYELEVKLKRCMDLIDRDIVKVEF